MSVQYLISLDKKENKLRTRPLEYIRILYDKKTHALSCPYHKTLTVYKTTIKIHEYAEKEK